jgi:hypothetical protein
MFLYLFSSALLISLNFPFICVLSYFLCFRVTFCFTNRIIAYDPQLLRISDGLLYGTVMCHVYCSWLRNCAFSQFLVSWGWVRLSPLGTSATNWRIVAAPDDRRWMWSNRWNENWQGKPKYSKKTCSSATLFTTNPTWPDLGWNPGRRGGKPATNRLSYGTAFTFSYSKICIDALSTHSRTQVTIHACVSIVVQFISSYLSRLFKLYFIVQHATCVLPISFCADRFGIALVLVDLDTSCSD